MKLSKGLFLAFAGLGLFACSNEDVTENGAQIEGLGAITVKIVNPSSRAISNPTIGGSTIKVGGGDITVKLFKKGEENGDPVQTATITATEIVNEISTVKFWNVVNPGKITVSRNGGIEDYSSTQIDASTPNMQAEPTLIPVFGSTTTFTLTDESESPALSEADKIIDAGAEEADKNKKFQMYTATVNMEIPVARLEVSNIKHIVTGEHETTGCQFDDLTIDGVYLDNIKPTSNGQLTDYCFETGAGTGTPALLKDEIKSPNNDFMTVDAVWPANEGEQAKAYAYNFYAPDEDDNQATVNDNPVFKIYFKTATSSNPAQPVSQPRYAVIEEYQDGDGNPVIFRKGYIYRITEATLTDKNITGDESGETLYGITVTVVEAAWSPFDIEAVWAE